MASPQTSPPAASAAGEALKAARRSQRMSAQPTGVDPRKFTLHRNAAREIRDAQVASSLAEWLSQETGVQIRGESPQEFCEDLQDGVVFCKLALRFGQVTRFRDPPKNEFQRLENFELFAKCMARMGLSSTPPPSRRDFQLAQVLPCLLEMAVLAQQHAGVLEMESGVPEQILTRASEKEETDDEPQIDGLSNKGEAISRPPAQTPVKEPPRKDVVVVNSLDEEEDEADNSPDAGMNHILGQLHIERMKRQRAGPPKLRILDVGGKQIVAIERPGEAIGSIVWPGAVELITYLHKSVGKAIFSSDNKGTILELGSGCGVCGIWAACEGGDVVVTDTASSIDLLWANVAANAQQIVRSGGSCSARPMDFTDGVSVEKLVRSLSQDGPLTIIASDVVYGETARPLVSALTKIFTARPDTKLYLSYKVRDAMQEMYFFDSVEFSEVGVGAQPTNGDLPSKIYLVTGLKAI